jgi:hypothetical protein
MARTGRDCRDGNRFVRTGAIVTVPEVVDGKSRLAWLNDTSENVGRLRGSPADASVLRDPDVAEEHLLVG